jgi:hypothetical protein
MQPKVLFIVAALLYGLGGIAGFLVPTVGWAGSGIHRLTSFRQVVR